MLKKLKLWKKPLFQKPRWSCDFPPRKMPVALKHFAISRQEKMAFSAPVGLSWDSPPPPTECADGRTYGCTDIRMYGRTDGRSRDYYVTSKISRINRLPYFLSNGAPLAGFARRLRYNLPYAVQFIFCESCKYFVVVVVWIFGAYQLLRDVNLHAVWTNLITGYIMAVTKRKHWSHVPFLVRTDHSKQNRRDVPWNNLAVKKLPITLKNCSVMTIGIVLVFSRVLTRTRKNEQILKIIKVTSFSSWVFASQA